MKTIPVAKAYGNSIFCDDIRQEVDGKVSFIGAYNGVMVVHKEFPVSLPKFAIAVTFFEKQNEAEGDITINIHLPGDNEKKPAASLKMGISQIRASLPKETPSIDSPDGELVRRMDIPFLFSPLVISQKGNIRVRAIVGDEIVKLGSLRIEQNIPIIAGPRLDTEELKVGF